MKHPRANVAYVLGPLTSSNTHHNDGTAPPSNAERTVTGASRDPDVFGTLGALLTHETAPFENVAEPLIAEVVLGLSAALAAPTRRPA